MKCCVRANICVSRTSHAMLLYYRGVCPARLSVAACAAIARRYILPTMPCHVTFNLMAFFPVIRSSRRGTHFFLPFYLADICARFFKPAENCSVPPLSSLYLSLAACVSLYFSAAVYSLRFDLTLLHGMFENFGTIF